MTQETTIILNKLSTDFSPSINDTAIILAAGHGKRIKSQTSKMLHEIWGIPTVERVYNACKSGLDNSNIIVVVGIKAEEVATTVGARDKTIFALQAEQNGTGHAVQMGLNSFDSKNYNGTVYVFPGDMGLIDSDTVKMFKNSFHNSHADMMVLTGIFEGDDADNSYGRIIRVKGQDINGEISGEDERKVIEIMEHKDIQALNPDVPYVMKFNGKEYSYSKEELIKNREFNSGVYAFKNEFLSKLVDEITSNNAQGEIYITDLISIFNKNGLTVDAVSPDKQYVIMGFNNKSVLKEMEAIARKNHYENLKDIILIEDPDDFFIHEDVIAQILEMDIKGVPLDIKIGKGVHIGRGAILNYNLTLMKNVKIDGNIIFGKDVVIWENAHLSCYENQKLEIGNKVEVLWGDIIKGNIKIGDNSRIESSVNMTGSDDFPVVIGENVTIKGTSYIFGSRIDEGMFIEHSVLIKKKLEKLTSANKTINEVKFYLPMPEGVDTISSLE